MFSVYHIILYILLLLSVIVKRRSANQFLLVCGVLLVIFCTLRNPSLYNDLVGYEEYFRRGELPNTAEGSFNIGYITLNNIVKYLTGSFTVLLGVVATIIITCYCKFFKYYSPYPVFSLALYFMVGFIFSLSGLRQALSVSTGLIFFHYLLKDNAKFCFVWLLISISLHTTAVILIPIWFLYRIPLSKFTIFIMIGGMVSVTLLMRTVGSLFLGLSEYYMKYIDMEAEGALERTLMKVFILIVFIYALREKIFEKNINYLLLLCLAFNVIIYVGGSSFFGIFRLRTYFEICEIVGIPVILYHVNYIAKQRRFLSYLGVFVYLVLLFLSFYRLINSNSIMTTPVYSTIFTKSTAL